jgi:hypothetical protein
MLTIAEEKDGCTVKKVIVFPVPSRDVTNQTLIDREYFSVVKTGLCLRDLCLTNQQQRHFNE